MLFSLPQQTGKQALRIHLTFSSPSFKPPSFHCKGQANPLPTLQHSFVLFFKGIWLFAPLRHSNPAHSFPKPSHPVTLGLCPPFTTYSHHSFRISINSAGLFQTAANYLPISLHNIETLSRTEIGFRTAVIVVSSHHRITAVEISNTASIHLLRPSLDPLNVFHHHVARQSVHQTREATA